MKLERFLRELGIEDKKKWGDTTPGFSPGGVSLELMLSRVDCLQIIEQAGLPVPSKSRCWMCPNQRDSEWLQLKRDMQGYFQKAVELEREIREDERFANCFFHISRKPLDQVAFDENSNVQPMQCGLWWCFI